jgi:hypothetical protein
MTKRITAALLLLALCGWLPAQAQVKTVYRCGGSYSDTPCPGGTVVTTDDPRSAAQRAQTDAATKRDARSAQVLEHERLKQEGKPVPAIILAPEPPASAAARPAAGKKLKKPEVFTAVSPKKPGDAPKKKKKKAEEA